MIMEPADFTAYMNADQATQGMMLQSPQWSLNIGSSLVYAGQASSTGNEDRTSAKLVAIQVDMPTETPLEDAIEISIQDVLHELIWKSLFGGTTDGSQLTPEQQGKVIFLTQLATARAAIATGNDINTALGTSQNAVLNNFMTPVSKFNHLQSNCTGSDSTLCQTVNRMAGGRSCSGIQVDTHYLCVAGKHVPRMTNPFT